MKSSYFQKACLRLLILIEFVIIDLSLMRPLRYRKKFSTVARFSNDKITLTLSLCYGTINSRSKVNS